MTIDEQLGLWLKGKPIHNNSRDECTPDFSCCNRELLASEEDRKRYYKAYCDGDNRVTHKMLADFLGKLLESKNLRVQTAQVIEFKKHESH